MSSFYVDPGGVVDLARLLDRLAEDVRAGHEYVPANTGLAGGEGWLNQLSGAHRNVVRTTLDWLAELHTVGTASADAVRHCVEYYRVTDAMAAGRLDATISAPAIAAPPNPGTDYFIRHSQLAPFADVDEPTACYTAVPDHSAEAGYQYDPSFWDLLGPSSLGRAVIWEATGFLVKLGQLDQPVDIFELAVKPVLGDWVGLRGCADVFRNLAEAMTVAAGNVQRARYAIPEVWRGNGANACDVHLDRLTYALGAARLPLRAIADEYQKAADGAAEFRNLVDAIVGELVDAAVVFTVAVAAGTATAETGVGPVIGGLVGVYEATKIVRLIHRIKDARIYTKAVIDGVQSSMDDFGQLNAAAFILPKLPEVAGERSTLPALPSLATR